MTPRINRASIAATLSLIAALAVHAQSEKPLDLSIQMPTGRACRASYPLPIRLVASNPETAFRGQIRIRSLGTGDKPLLSREVAFGSGDFGFSLQPLLPAGTANGLAIEVLDAAGTVISREERLLSPISSRRKAILLMVSPPRQPDVETSLRAALHSRAPSSLEQSDDLRQLAPALIPLEGDFTGFPDSWQGLAMFDAILWDGSPLALTPEQRLALRSWLQLGGKLIVLPDQATLSIPSPLPELTGPELSLPSKQVPTSKACGRGTILVLAAVSADKPATVSQLAIATDDRPPDSEMLTLEDADSAPGAASLHSALRQSLARSVGYAKHDFAPFVLFCLVYLGFIAFLEPLFLRTLRVPWFTWLSFPMITVVFCFFAISLFRGSQLSPSAHASISIVDHALDGLGRELRFDCIRTPAGHQPQLQIAPDSLIFPATVGTAIRDREAIALQSTISLDSPPSHKLVGTGTYVFVDRVTPLHLQTPLVDTSDLVVRGDFLYGKVTVPPEMEIALAFAVWNGFFYELDGSLKVVRRSMAVNDALLRQRLLDNLNGSEAVDKLAIARVAERIARIAANQPLIDKGQLLDYDEDNTRHHRQHRLVLDLAAGVPADYGTICLITRPQTDSHDGILATTCYRQPFKPKAAP